MYVLLKDHESIEKKYSFNISPKQMLKQRFLKISF